MLPAQLLRVGGGPTPVHCRLRADMGTRLAPWAPGVGSRVWGCGSPGKAIGMQLGVQGGFLSEDVIPFPRVPRRNES